jgi:hypothetical protein
MVTVGVVGAPCSGIELVLKQISLPVAQIRVICNEMARAIVLTSEHWFLLSGTVNSDG